MLGLFLSHEAIRQNVISEGKRIEAQEAREHQKIKQLDYQLPEEIPDVVYNETDSTYIRKQNKDRKKGRKQRHLEVKLAVGYTGKEPCCHSGKQKSKKLSQRLVYAEIKAVFKEPLTAKDMIKRRAIAPFIEAELPCYRGPDQSKPWIGILHELAQARMPS